ncbi:MAG: H-NS histone family protein [Magnetococcales bacterium]|nr:H-NS histone family protein [Magnetococcales bacterium]
MSRYGGWAPYVPVAERRRQAARQVEKMRKKGQLVAPVVIQGQAIATTFWGKAWCKNLESYQDYENRLPRGRTYVRNGSVLDLQIQSKEIRAIVSGSSIYQIKISISAVPDGVWQNICGDCSGGIDSLVELLQGRFNKGVMDRLCRQDGGLFPSPSEIKFSCSCPDYAYMCKHVAAVLYGVGARLDEQPELLFLLRAVDQNDLIAQVDTSLPMSMQHPSEEKLLATEDIADLFGLDILHEDATAKPVIAQEAVVRTVGKRGGAAAQKPVQEVIKASVAAVNKPKVTVAEKAASAVGKASAAKMVTKVRTKQGGSRPDVMPPVSAQDKQQGKQEELYQKMLSLVKSAGFDTVEEFIATQGKQSGNEMLTKYRNPHNAQQSWSGKGRKPNWVVAYLDAGGRMEELEDG